MSYSKEVLTRARARLAQQKADRESENAARLQAAYTRIPRLKEIDMAMARLLWNRFANPICSCSRKEKCWWKSIWNRAF